MSRTATFPAAAAFAVAALVAAPAPADTIATTKAFLPAVNIDGATGTFLTDVWIFNPEPSLENDVTLYFTPAGVDGSNLQGLRINPPLAPRESVALKDILKNYFGKTKTFGLLEVRGSYPIMVTSNTYNVAGAIAGTYGQYSPGQPDRNALGFDDFAEHAAVRVIRAVGAVYHVFPHAADAEIHLVDRGREADRPPPVHHCPAE